jgi:FAD/FMN-containing dehydrogenase
MSEVTRREFVRRAAIAGAALSCLPGRIFAAGTPASSRSAFDTSTIQAFASGLHGRVVLPSDPTYESARRIFSWNPRTEKHPAMIVRCGAASDVAHAIEFAQVHKLEVAIRGGGHDVLGKSLCENGMVIDLSLMKAITVDTTQRVARVEAGVISDELNQAARNVGLAAVLGCNPAVGISGLTLGGGLGWLLGRFGAACDNLRSVELITADAKAVVASADENPDLFWTLHGGGGNFGVATSFEIDLHPAPPTVGGFVTYPRDKAREFYRFYRDYMKDAPDGLAVETSLDTRSITAMVCYTGDPAQSDRTLKPLRSFGPLLHGSLEPMPYIEFPPPPLW